MSNPATAQNDSPKSGAQENKPTGPQEIKKPDANAPTDKKNETAVPADKAATGTR